MNLKEIEDWYTKGGEVFIEHSEEIKWLIKQVKTLEDMLFDVGVELTEIKGLPSPFDGT